MAAHHQSLTQLFAQPLGGARSLGIGGENPVDLREAILDSCDLFPKAHVHRGEGSTDGAFAPIVDRQHRRLVDLVGDAFRLQVVESEQQVRLRQVLQLRSPWMRARST